MNEAPMIWIISPDRELRRLIGLNLSKRSLQIQEAASPDELAPDCPRPQLIILDIDPPAYPGWQIAETLRQNAQCQTIPFILLLTAAPTPSQLQLLQPALWVEKPLAMETLLALVRKTLSSKQLP